MIFRIQAHNKRAVVSRRTYLVSLLSCVLALGAATPVAAESYPSRPVTFIVPFAVGSSTDIMTRVVVQALNTRLKTNNFIVDNRPGANGTIGSNLVAKAKPDGYTFLVGTGTTHTQVPWMMNITYDPIKDFSPVAGIGGVPMALVVGPNSPINSLDDLKKVAGASPGKYAYGTAFGMSTACGEFIKKGFKIDLIQVYYKSSPQVLLDVAGGQVAVLCTDFNTAMGPIRNKQVRPIAVTSARPSPLLPDVPSLVQAIPGFPEMRSWVGVFAPRGAPTEITQMLGKEILEITQLPETQKILSPNGFERLPVTGAEFQGFVEKELVKWQKLIEDAGIPKE